MFLAAVGIGIALFLSFVIYLRRLVSNASSQPAIPGLQPSSDKHGNVSDIGKAGSLHQFLMGLHKKYGPIASFWWNTEYTVSIASAELFKEHQHVFDRPVNQFKMFEQFITPYSIQYANGEDGKARKFTYDKVFSHDALEIYYDKLQQVADDIAEEALAFKRSYDTAWGDMEARLTNPELHSEGSETAENFKKALSTLRKIVAHAIEEREEHCSESHDFLLIDAVIGHHPKHKQKLQIQN